MRTFGPQWEIENVATWLRGQAFRTPPLDMSRHQPANRAILQACICQHYPSGSQLICTRETGYHSSGWWKNPDYERCLHLSVCFRDPASGAFVDFDKKRAAEWVHHIFGATSNLVWVEGPAGPEGKKCGTHHYRVFYGDPQFTAPILPRGEVYTREFTEVGWRSWSDVADDLKREADAALTQ